jgi:hypothetical protein
MSSFVEAIKPTLSSLPAAERAELAHYLLRSLDAQENGAKPEGLTLYHRA